MLKRFLVFYGKTQDIQGGAHDFLVDVDTKNEAFEVVRKTIAKYNDENFVIFIHFFDCSQKMIDFEWEETGAAFLEKYGKPRFSDPLPKKQVINKAPRDKFCKSNGHAWRYKKGSNRRYCKICAEVEFKFNGIWSKFSLGDTNTPPDFGLN
jgi:NADH pyrophosphatase NudC (nudix superfamily)